MGMPLTRKLRRRDGSPLREPDFAGARVTRDGRRRATVSPGAARQLSARRVPRRPLMETVGRLLLIERKSEQMLFQGEQGTGNRQQGTGNREKGTGNREEQRVKGEGRAPSPPRRSP